MLPNRTTERSLLITTDEIQSRFIEIAERNSLVTYLLPSEKYELFHYQTLFDYWLYLCEPSQHLIEHFEHRMIYHVRAEVFTQLQQISAKIPSLLQVKEQCDLAFQIATHVIAMISRKIMLWIEEDLILQEAMMDMKRFIGKDLTALFRHEFEKIEAYPKELVLLQQRIAIAIRQYFIQEQAYFVTEIDCLVSRLMQLNHSKE